MDSPDIDGMGIKALKEFIASAGLSTEDCLDKADLRARAREAVEEKKKKPKAPAGVSAAPAAPERLLGEYSCIVSGPDDLLAGTEGASSADLLIIGLHGLGARNTDLAAVPAMLAAADPALKSKRVVGVFPQAPSGPIGPAWWTFDMMAFMQAQMTPQGPQREAMVARMIRTKPTDLDACRSKMSALTAAARSLAGGAKDGPLPMSKVVFAGFSLGAITSLDIALQTAEGEGPAGVVFMNGAPIVVDEWAERLTAHRGLRVHLTGGYQDTTLPNECSEWVRQLLEAKGAAVTHKYHMGGHEIGGADILQGIAKFVASFA